MKDKNTSRKNSKVNANARNKNNPPGEGKNVPFYFVAAVTKDEIEIAYSGETFARLSDAVDAMNDTDDECVDDASDMRNTGDWGIYHATRVSDARVQKATIAHISGDGITLGNSAAK